MANLLSTAITGTLTTTSNVGIGTTNPGERLHVVGPSNNWAAHFVSGTSESYFSYSAGYGAYINAGASASSSTYILELISNGSTRMFVRGDGNVGIGTTAPSEKLEVNGNVQIGTSVDAKLYMVSSGGNGYNERFFIEGYADGGTYGGGFKLSTRNDSNIFNTAVTVDRNGNVGFGTTSPVSKLNINNGDAWINVTDTLRGLQFGYAGPSHGSYRAAVMGGAESYGGTDSGMLTFHTQSGYVVSAIPPERMRITSGGNVGIGTTNPGDKLEIDGGTVVIPNGQFYRGRYNGGTPQNLIGISTGNVIQVGDFSSSWNLQLGGTSAIQFMLQGTERMRITSGGNVGIGTTSPSYPLHVANSGIYHITAQQTKTNTADTDAYATFYVINDAGTSQVRGYLGAGGASVGNTTMRDHVYVGAQTNHGLRLFTNDLARVTVNPSGNVGIGTTSPQSRLDLSPPASQSTISTLGYSANAQLNIRIPNSVGDVGQIVFTNDAGPTAGYASIGVVMTSGTGVGLGDMVFATKSIGGDAASTERMRINSSGYVGIGVTSIEMGLQIGDGRGLLVGPSGASGSTYVSPIDENTINGSYGIGSDNADLWLNYRGYRDGFDYFRDTRIGNGKGTAIVMVDGSAGNVGIGTTAPTGKLDIRSGGLDTNPLTIYGTTSGAKMFDFRDDSAGGVTAAMFRMYNASGTETVRLFPGTTTSHHSWILPTGNFGIGTTSPSYKLHIDGTARATQYHLPDGGDIAWNGGYASGNPVIAANGDEFRMYAAGNATTNTLYLSDTRLAYSGNVGIGTTAPGNKLHIKSGSSGFSGTYDSRYKSIVEHNGEAYYATYVPDDSYSGLRFNNSSGLRGFIDYYHGTQGDGFVYSAIKQHIWLINGSERVRISSNGNVGIGTTNPLGITNNSGLQIDRGGHSTIMLGNGTTTGGVVQSSDDTRRVFIGANIYDDVSGSWSQFNGNAGYAAFDAVGTDTTGLARILVGSPADSGYEVDNIFFEALKTDSDSYIKLRTNTDNALYINNSGNVGIGTTSPGAKLDVTGAADTEGLVSLQLRAGNSSDDFRSNQITFGYGGGEGYRHAIKTRHHSSDYINAIDFYVWRYGTDGVGNIGTQHVMTIIQGGPSSDGGGRVGIGTTYPGAKLHLSGAGATEVRISSTTANTNSLLSFYEGSLASWGIDAGQANGKFFIKDLYNTNTRLTIDASGNVGIGTTSPSAKLDVSGDARTSGYVLVNNHSNNALGYRISNTSGTAVSAMFVNSSNQLVIAAGAVDQINLNKKVLVNGVALGVNVSPSGTAGRIDASNDIVAYSSSDERLKHNIAPIENALDKVKSLTGVEFDWKPEYKHAHGYEGHDTGIIAQQVQDVMPSAVRTNDTGFLAVRYEKLIGLLVEGMKEQQAQIDELKAKLDGLTK